MKKITALLFISTLSLNAFSEENTSKVKYKSGKDIDFESLLIEGQNRRPEISVVTGNVGGDDNGLVKLREDFIDQMADDAGESVE